MNNFHPSKHPHIKILKEEILDAKRPILDKEDIINILNHPDTTVYDDHREFFDIKYTCPSSYDKIFMNSSYYNNSPNLYVRFKLSLDTCFLTLDKRLVKYPLQLINFYPGLLDIRIYKDAFTIAPQLLESASDDIKNALLL